MPAGRERRPTAPKRRFDVRGTATLVGSRTCGPSAGASTSLDRALAATRAPSRLLAVVPRDAADDRKHARNHRVQFRVLGGPALPTALARSRAADDPGTVDLIVTRAYGR